MPLLGYDTATLKTARQVSAGGIGVLARATIRSLAAQLASLPHSSRYWTLLQKVFPQAPQIALLRSMQKLGGIDFQALGPEPQEFWGDPLSVDARCQQLFSRLLASERFEERGLLDLSYALRSDPEIVGAAIARAGLQLGLAHQQLRQNPALLDIALTAGSLLSAVPTVKRAHWERRARAGEDILGKPEFFHQAVIVYGPAALEYAPQVMLEDHGWMRKVAVLKTAALEYASPALIADQAFIQDVAESRPEALRYASPCLFERRDFCLWAVKTLPRLLGLLPIRFALDHEIAEAAVRTEIAALRWLNPALRRDPTLILRLVAITPIALRFASEELRANAEFVLQACRIDERCFSGASPDLLHNRQFVLQAMRIDANVLLDAPAPLREDAALQRIHRLRASSCLQHVSNLFMAMWIVAVLISIRQMVQTLTRQT